MVNGQPFWFFGKLVSAQMQSDLYGNPGAKSAKRDGPRKNQQIIQGREKGGSSDGTIFSPHGGAFSRLIIFSDPPLPNSRPNR
jgi:hypothetical protein